jgi:hypothetical protein
MDPFITNGVGPLLPALQEGRQERDRDPLPRRKRPGTDEEAQDSPEPAFDVPKHTLDDLA